jgi:pyruvate formate lyase activating enzyme
MREGVTADIFDVKRFAIHDGPGIRTTVFFRGCPLECWWCHNPEARIDCGRETYRKRSVDHSLPASDNVIGPEVRIERLVDEIERDKVFYDQSHGGVTASGGEPMMQIGFLERLLTACRARGIATNVDTSAYASWTEFEKVLDIVDLFMVDLKLIDDKQHLKYTGVSNKLILENFDRLIKAGSRVRARLPMIPGLTDTADNVDSLIGFLGRYRELEHVSLLPYNRLGEDKFERLGLEYRPGAIETQTPRHMKELAGRFEKAGIEVRIGG